MWTRTVFLNYKHLGKRLGIGAKLMLRSQRRSNTTTICNLTTDDEPNGAVAIHMLSGSPIATGTKALRKLTRN